MFSLLPCDSCCIKYPEKQMGLKMNKLNRSFVSNISKFSYKNFTDLSDLWPTSQHHHLLADIVSSATWYKGRVSPSDQEQD